MAQAIKMWKWIFLFDGADLLHPPQFFLPSIICRYYTISMGSVKKKIASVNTPRRFAHEKMVATKLTLATLIKL